VAPVSCVSSFCIANTRGLGDAILLFHFCHVYSGIARWSLQSPSLRDTRSTILVASSMASAIMNVGQMIEATILVDQGEYKTSEFPVGSFWPYSRD
jgi:hypothetical protein